MAKYYGTDALCLNPSPKAFKWAVLGGTKNAVAGRGILAVI